jgi:hypothetical protein
VDYLRCRECRRLLKQLVTALTRQPVREAAHRARRVHVHFDGSAWSPVGPPQLPATQSVPPLSSVWGSGPTDVWAVGIVGLASSNLMHWDGITWSSAASGATSDLFAVWGSGPSDVWAAGGTATVHFNGSVWSSVASGTTAELYGIWGSGAADIWAVGQGFTTSVIVHYDGSAWSSVTSPMASVLNGVWGTGPTDVWAVGSSNGLGGLIMHWAP